MSTTPLGVARDPVQAAAPEDLVLWTPADAAGSVAARFERVVRARPDAVAVQSGERAASYAELNQAANRIAHALLARLGEGNVPVASLLSDRVRVIQALMGVLKAGKIHTPLAVEVPAARLQLMLADAEPAVVLVDRAHLALAEQLGLPAERLLDLDALDPGLPTGDPGLAIALENFAFIIYTSGSTGRPKGVVRTNGFVLGSMARGSVSGRLHFGVRVMLMGSPGYVAPVTSILWSLLNGATLCPFTLEQEGLASLRDFLLRERIMQFGLTASTFRHFAATLHPEDRFPAVRLVALAGEAVLRKDFELFKQHFGPDALLVTGLGSTEMGGLSEVFLNQQSVVTERIVPTGYPDNIDREVYIVDADGKRVGPGVAGEIVVRSKHLETGYWRNPELSAQAFAPDPDGGGWIFRTGDLGLLRADGLLEHHGRKDFQVKIRGNRVELGEIEMALFDLGNIREAVVVARPDAAGETRLIAYVVPERAPAPMALSTTCTKDTERNVTTPAQAVSTGAAALAHRAAAGEIGDLVSTGAATAPTHRIAVGETRGLVSTGAAAHTHRIAVGETRGLISAGYLRRRLAEVLPAHMVPATFVVLEALPLTASGKIDRAQLPVPDLPRAQSVSARDALEAQLAQVWEQLLHVQQVGMHEDFFDLGGNSLLAMRLFAEIERTLGRKLPLSILFQAGTIAKLATLIRADDALPAGGSCLVPIQPGGGRRPFFLAAGGRGGDAELLIYARLARFLSAEQPFYGLRARVVGKQPGPNGEVEAIAAGHLAEIRAVQPRGPYLLGGECVGGVVAIEMARQLRMQGDAVSLLCLLDTIRPTWRTRLQKLRTAMAHRWAQTERNATLAARNATRVLRGRPPLSEPQRARPDFGYALATARYRPRRSAEHITLLINQDYHRQSPGLGWQSLAGGGIEVHALPGTHETYIRQHVQAAGECLRDCLERAQAQPAEEK